VYVRARMCLSVCVSAARSISRGLLRYVSEAVAVHVLQEIYLYILKKEYTKNKKIHKNIHKKNIHSSCSWFVFVCSSFSVYSYFK